jgi:hypothetical protein
MILDAAPVVTAPLKSCPARPFRPAGPPGIFENGHSQEQAEPDHPTAAARAVVSRAVVRLMRAATPPDLAGVTCMAVLNSRASPRMARRQPAGQIHLYLGAKHN